MAYPESHSHRVGKTWATLAVPSSFVSFCSGEIDLGVEMREGSDEGKGSDMQYSEA